jgi:hypothetical protein
MASEKVVIAKKNVSMLKITSSTPKGHKEAKYDMAVGQNTGSKSRPFG